MEYAARLGLGVADLAKIRRRGDRGVTRGTTRLAAALRVEVPARGRTCLTIEAP